MCGVEMMWFECIPSLVTVSEEKKRKKDVRGFLSDRISSFLPLKDGGKRCAERFLCENMDGDGWERSYAWNVFV